MALRDGKRQLDFRSARRAAYRECMGASYDDNTGFAEDERGTPICYDWLRDRDGEAPPVRVQVRKAYVEKEWRLSWKEDATVTQRFDAAKRRHLDAALGAKLLPGTDYRVYTIE